MVFTFVSFPNILYVFLLGNKNSNQYYLSKIRQLSEGTQTLGNGLKKCGKKRDT